MVKGKKVTRVVKTAGRKQQTAAAKGAAKQNDGFPLCEGCGKVVTDDTRALQCERCSGKDTWKCTECLNVSDEAYDILTSDSGGCFHWFCDRCTAVVMAPAAPISDCGAKLDAMVRLLEQLLERTTSMEQKLGEKADLKIVEAMDARIQQLEKEGTATDTNVNTVQAVEEALTKQKEEDIDMNSRKNNVIIYRLKEEDGDKPDIRKTKDKTFFTELCGKVLGVEVRDQDVSKMFRLGKMTPGRDRPLLIGLKSESIKNEIMSNLNKLKDTDDRYKRVGIAHDLSPKQREEIRKALETAGRHTVVGSGSAENQKFRVVGQGSKLRVIKVDRT